MSTSILPSEMPVVSLREALDVARHVVLRQNKPLMVWGPPGVGKSAMVRQLTIEAAAYLADIRLGQYDSVDLRGFPNVNTATGLTVWHAPSTLPFVGNPMFPTDRPIIVFLDEINSAKQDVQAVAYQLILDRRIGEHVLMPNVRLIAAGNREGDKGVTHRMPTPLANRFTHIEVLSDTNTWCQWAQDAGLPAIGIAFMQFRKNLLNTFDPARTAKAFATERSWETALRFYADTEMPDTVKQVAIAGTIGQGVAAEFFGFVEVWGQLVPIASILKAPKTVPMPESLSLQWAMAIHVSGAMTTATVGALHTYLSRMAPEYVLCAWQLAIRRDSTLTATPEFMLFAAEYKAVFTS